MLCKLRQTYFFILILILLSSCQTRWASESFQGRKSHIEEIKKRNKEKKEEEKYRENQRREREKHYNRQAASAKINWDLNQAKSSAWMESQFHNKTFKYKLKQFFKQFRREPNPLGAHHRKHKLKKRHKENLFQRIFKIDKRRKKM